MPSSLSDAPPPEAVPSLRRVALRVTAPIDKFLHVEAASGVALLVAALVALAWANSRFGDAYEHLWHAPVGVRLGSLSFERPLHFWINDVLMSVFFFVAGLELRREIHDGELSTARKAALPFAAAIGGMIAPALIYVAIARGPGVESGWGIPIATDIAFALGVFALLGSRVPPGLRVLLLAIAILDDLGAILVIAFFYSGAISGAGLAVAVLGIGLTLLFQRFGVRRPVLYVLPGAVTWIGVYRAGIHPTIAGVALGLLTPPRAWYGLGGFEEAAGGALDEIRERRAQGQNRGRDIEGPLREIARAKREALAPTETVEMALHPWVAFVIMPLFALANAGVRVGSDLGALVTSSVAIAVTLGLVLGKPVGMILAVTGATKIGLGHLPKGVSRRGVAVLGVVAGIGFTMSIFIAELAFQGSPSLASAKLGVLAASIIAGVLAIAIGRAVLPARSGG